MQSRAAKKSNNIQHPHWVNKPANLPECMELPHQQACYLPVCFVSELEERFSELGGTWSKIRVRFSFRLASVHDLSFNFSLQDKLPRLLQMQHSRKLIEHLELIESFVQERSLNLFARCWTCLGPVAVRVAKWDKAISLNSAPRPLTVV
jgi:hypothetical protein